MHQRSLMHRQNGSWAFQCISADQCTPLAYKLATPIQGTTFSERDTPEALCHSLAITLHKPISVIITGLGLGTDIISREGGGSDTPTSIGSRGAEFILLRLGIVCLYGTHLAQPALPPKVQVVLAKNRLVIREGFTFTSELTSANTYVVHPNVQFDVCKYQPASVSYLWSKMDLRDEIWRKHPVILSSVCKYSDWNSFETGITLGNWDVSSWDAFPKLGRWLSLRSSRIGQRRLHWSEIYHPIGILAVLGNTVERMLVGRLQCTKLNNN
ncbi:hypothetical protein EVAR_19095_1 [Eumeta japonica]|uniref:Uncharacterized protein n=1 Tax=Eumeta variegata TaxID=151549 RepID=A0A4C1UQI2_EUMVA|nr:hypothetical protein EVAR_19095_1 [Eumeta japonica]